MSIWTLYYNLYDFYHDIIKIIDTIFALSIGAGEKLIKSPGSQRQKAKRRLPEHRARSVCD